jgi:hypothetical protein
MDFRMNGKDYHLTRDEVIGRVRGVRPGRIQAHLVEIEGVEFPVKQAFALATGLDVLDFNTNEARRILAALGFAVRRVEPQ